MYRVRGDHKPFLLRVLLAILISMLFTGTGTLFSEHTAAHSNGTTCAINSPAGNVQHVIYVQFDNVHLTRDNPKVPSDLEQMPNLFNFLKDNGTVLANHHTPLIAHTATDILTSLTGVYGDRHGVPISNSYRYFNPDGTTSSTGSFSYWTSPVGTTTNTTYNMLSESKKNAPAPWVPYTRAGCNVGAVAMANMVLENTQQDVNAVFGANSPEVAEVKANPNQAYSDFVGVAVHCAKGDQLCASQKSSKNDLLPDEPGGYTGYQGLFGHKYVAPQLSGAPLQDLNGKVIQDDQGHVSFPGFNGMTPAVSLSYVAQMQEHNIPITYAYIADAHDPHTDGGSAYGPGSPGYVETLKSYNDAFGKFFARLKKDGITKNNTLFAFTADENDHFAGGKPTPANCDGIHIPCTYNNIGEVSTNLTGLLATQKGLTTPFTVHADTAPTIYITGNPGRDAEATRNFERAAADLTATNPISGKEEKITNYLADPVEMQLLHMVTADPTRTPTLTLFAKPDYSLYAGAPNCNQPCVKQDSSYAWMHGDVSPDINTTWLGMAGPGIRNLGLDGNIWSDHTDIRPTMLSLLGLKDDYRHDGRVLFETLENKAFPQTVRNNLAFYVRLAQVYKQINAPVGALGLSTLSVSTRALASNSPNDATYQRLEQFLQTVTSTRNTLATQIITILETASFGTNASGTHANVQLAPDHTLQDLLKQCESLFKKIGQEGQR